MDDKSFKSACEIWQPDRPPRVWSILVTLFGDIAQTPGAHLSGAAVNAILSGINIKPEAIRVALHRLRNDGWIESTKVGRKSNYSLTEWGLAECRAANPQIYGPWPEQSQAYLVAIGSGARHNIKGADKHVIAPNLFITAAHVDAGATLVVPLSKTQSVPSWVSDNLCSEDIQAAARDFERRLKAFGKLDLAAAGLTHLQIAILRTIIVHEWRRIILRVPNLPDFLLPKGCLDRECRQMVDETLTRLGKPHPADLNQI